MELILAQNHEAMSHLPIAASVLAAIAAIVLLFVVKKELRFMWAVLAIVAMATAVPAALTGIMAAKGRLYIDEGFIVNDEPESADIKTHQTLQVSGFVVSIVLAVLGYRSLRGKESNKYFVAAVSVALALLWGIGSHVGGKALWSPETFPAYEHLLPENRTE